MKRRPTSAMAWGRRVRRPVAARGRVAHGRAAPIVLLALAAALGVSVFVGARNIGAYSSTGSLEVVWGRRGIAEGRLQKPRAAAIDARDRIYIVDKAARIQVFDADGELLQSPWKTPEYEFGKPTGLSMHPDGTLMVADTHYNRILFYTPEGKLLEDRTLGGVEGQKPGEFGLVTDAVVDSKGNIYVSEYGEFDRIQKFSPDGKFLRQWGGHGSEPGKFRRPQNMAIDELDRIWVVDACNHRVQIFDTEGNCVKIWGEHGPEVGKLTYPYDIVLADDLVYICEFGNHRVQKFTRDGESLGAWGEPGRGPGQLHNPWAMVRDTRGRIFVIDTNNHRVQRIRL